jgi:hypothetical protein
VCLDNFSVEVEALKVKCLNGQGECVFEEVHCHPVIKQIRAGVLIFSQETVWGLEVNETNKLVRVDQGIGKGTTKLYPWSKFTMIQTAQRIVYSLQPEDEVDPIFWSLVNVTTWNSQLRNRVLQIKRNNISRLLEESKETGIRIEKLGDDLQEMRGNVDSFNGFSVADICAFVAIGLWGVTLTLVIVALTHTRRSAPRSKEALQQIERSIEGQKHHQESAFTAWSREVNNMGYKFERLMGDLPVASRAVLPPTYTSNGQALIVQSESAPPVQSPPPIPAPVEIRIVQSAHPPSAPTKSTTSTQKTKSKTKTISN